MPCKELLDSPHLAGLSGGKGDKHMTPTSRILSLACLAAFALLFAVSTSAQDHASQMTNKLQLHQLQPNSDPSAARTSQAPAEITSSDVSCPTSTDYGFASGSGISYMKVCVTTNGNVDSFESPAGVEQINGGILSNTYEGYGICDGSTDAEYYDYVDYFSPNWGTPTTVSQSATSVKIQRSTSDGLWTLTQTFTAVAGTPHMRRLHGAQEQFWPGEECLAVALRHFCSMGPKFHT
jgi:hypothetical protein